MQTNNANAVSTAAETIQDGSSAPETFDPSEGLVGILWRAIEHNEDILVTLESGAGIVLVPSRGEYAGYASDMRTFCEAGVEQYTVKCLDSDYRKQFERGKTLQRCMFELLWQAGFFGSKGRLIVGCGRYDVVQLTRWPNLTRVPAMPSAMAIAALLSRYPTHISIARRLTGVTAEEINKFCSAAFASRSLKILSRTEAVDEPELKPHSNSSIFGRVMDRLRSL